LLAYFVLRLVLRGRYSIDEIAFTGGGRRLTIAAEATIGDD